MRLQPQDMITLLNVFLPSVILTNFRQYIFQSHLIMLISLDEVAHACNPRIEDSKPVLLQVKAILSCIPRPTDLILIQLEMANFNSIYLCIILSYILPPHWCLCSQQNSFSPALKSFYYFCLVSYWWQNHKVITLRMVRLNKKKLTVILMVSHISVYLSCKYDMCVLKFSY